MSQEEAAEALTVLRTYPDVQAVRLEPGQVLQYPGHYPLGIWVVLAGGLRLLPQDLALDAEAEPFLLPALADLDRPASVGALVERAADVLFIPHSLAREDRALRRLLRRSALPTPQPPRAEQAMREGR